MLENPYTTRPGSDDLVEVCLALEINERCNLFTAYLRDRGAVGAPMIKIKPRRMGCTFISLNGAIIGRVDEQVRSKLISFGVE